MSRFLILLLCCLVEVRSKCFTGPAGKLPDGCKIGNLTVTVYPTLEIINGNNCNNTMDETLFNNAPREVRFQFLRGSNARGYLLAAVDQTSKELMWMISNLTIGPGYRIFPCNNGRYCQEIIPWRKPFSTTTLYSRQHVVEFLVMEEHRTQPDRMYITSPALFASPFNLTTWINSQQNSGITICGPVGGGSAVPSQFFLAAPSTPNTTPSSSNDFHHHRRSNNSNRHLLDEMLLAGLVAIYTIFKY